jgi:hypothetical protein
MVEESGPRLTPPERRIVRLQVGETVFTTTQHTLCKESAYFQSLLSDQYQQLTSGEFFVDADPGLFAYILRYLRHGIYPVCFSQESGHDLATYLGIERLATEFGIEKLAKWLVDRQYESAVECSVSFDDKSPFGSRSYTSTDHVNCYPRRGGWVCMIKTRFTARREAFLDENTDHA